MSFDSTRLLLEEVARDLDMLVYQLEGLPPDDEEVRLRMRRRLREALERARDRIQDVADGG